MPFDSSIANSFKNLRAIATRSTGYDYINQKACNQRNIAILNVQNYGETSVAEFTMGLILGMSRKIFNAIDDIKNHQIYKKSYVGKDLENMTLGVVGTGAIGAALSYGFRLGRVVPFAVINGNYAWTSTDRTDNIIQTLIVGARVGVNVPLPKDMKVAFMLGTQYTYMPMGNQVQGSYTVTLPPGTLVNQNEPYTITSKYKADAEYSSPWTFNAGVMYSVNRYFDILAEVGFLTRLTAMVTLQANF